MPPQHHYFGSLSHRHTMSRMNKRSSQYPGPLSIASGRPRSVSLGSPIHVKGILDSHHCCDIGVQDDATFDNFLQQPYDLSKMHPRNHNYALVAALKQLDHLMTSRNICRRFMLRTCAEQKCAYLHDAIFRDEFMVPLFGDAYTLSRLPQQDLCSQCPKREFMARDAQINPASKHLEDDITEDRYKSDIISFEPPSTLNVAAGLYTLPSPSVHLSTGVNTEMDAEKSEMQAEADSEEVRQRHSVAGISSTLRPHQRRRHKLRAVRDRMGLWGKSAWRRSMIMKQEKSQNESGVGLEQTRGR